MSPSEFIYTVLLRPKPLRRAANALLRRILPKTVRIHGATIVLNPDDPVISGGLTLGVYEREEIAFFQRHFQPRMVLVDVGANVGLYTGMALATPGFSGAVLCVEPDAESRRHLEATIAANQPHSSVAVSLCACAASDQAGTAPFYRNPENRGDNRIYRDALVQESGSVETDTLDSLCAKHGITQIDFLKIDVQGAEGRVLAGARQVLSASPNVILMTEFWPHGLNRCGTTAAEYLAMLSEMGFILQTGNARPLPESAWDELIRTTSGRKYVNLYGFKRCRAPVGASHA